MESDIFEKIREILVKQLCVAEDKVISEAKLVDDLGAESIDLIELKMVFEDVFGIDEIPDKKLEGLMTVQNIMDYIEERKANYIPQYSI